MTMVNSKPVLKQVSLLGLLQAIAATQPQKGTQGQKSTLKDLKKMIATSQPDVTITWTCITHARTEAVAEGFVHFENYNHTLTSTGEKELADLQAQSKKKELATV
jgi:hypothetical protein